MGTRCLAAVIAGMVWCYAAPASADPKAEVAAKAKAAMASYDSLDYEIARKLLNQALAIAKKARLDKDPIVARVYLDLGIAQLASSDPEAARVAFLSAVQIDPQITIDPAYKSPELVKLLDEAKAAAADSGEPAEDDAECKAVRGLQHAAIEHGRPGASQSIEVLVASDLSPAKVVVMYRPEGAIDFTEVRLAQKGSCRFAGTIPASAMHGSVVDYYVAAYDGSSKVLAAKGSSGAPNRLALREAGAAEDGAKGTRSGGEVRLAPGGVAGHAAGGRKPDRIMFAVSGGTGAGYVTGKTESNNVVQTCCIGNSPVVVTSELAYVVSRKLSIGVAARFGFPIGANTPGHSTVAPSGFLRARYALSSSGDGIRLMGQVGAGILRNTLKLNDPNDMMDGPTTDVVAQGPLLFGAGIGYVKHLGGTLAFLVDLSAIVGVAVTDKVGTAIHLNSGVSADMSVGLAVGF